MKLSGVTPGSPADMAGIRAGDIIVGIGAHEVADLQGMTDALRAHKPGDVVEFACCAAAERLSLKVTLGTARTGDLPDSGHIAGVRVPSHSGIQQRDDRSMSFRFRVAVLPRG